MSINKSVVELIERGYVGSAFQPIVDLDSGRMMGYEALLRGPKGTPLARPDLIFGPRSKLVPDTLHKLDAACVAAALRSGRMLVPHGLLFVNVHMSTLLGDRKLKDHFLKLLESSNIAPNTVVIELSERTSDCHTRTVSRIINDIKKLGFRFALDDFGTAYAWLENLYRFEPSYVKLDRGLIKDIHLSHRKQDLVLSVKEMCEKLGSEVIAEGIEVLDELVTVMTLNIPYGQGFHFGLPMGAMFWISERAVKTVYKPWFKAAQLTSIV